MFLCRVLFFQAVKFPLRLRSPILYFLIWPSEPAPSDSYEKGAVLHNNNRRREVLFSNAPILSIRRVVTLRQEKKRSRE